MILQFLIQLKLPDSKIKKQEKPSFWKFFCDGFQLIMINIVSSCLLAHCKSGFFVSPLKKLYNVKYIFECEEQKNEGTYL